MGHKDRCDQLRRSYQQLNQGQGLGFLMFATVIDKRKLSQIAVSLASVGVTAFTTLYALGDSGTHT
jgi:hypothetical protein